MGNTMPRRRALVVDGQPVVITASIRECSVCTHQKLREPVCLLFNEALPTTARMVNKRCRRCLDAERKD